MLFISSYYFYYCYFYFYFYVRAEGEATITISTRCRCKLKKQKKGGKNVVVATTRPNEQYLEVAAKKTEAPLLCAPLGGGGY